MQVYPLPYPRRVLFTEFPVHDTVPVLSLAGARGETVMGVVALRLEHPVQRTEGVVADITDLDCLDHLKVQIAMPVPVRFPTPDQALPGGKFEPTDRECDYPCCLPDPLMPGQLTENLAPRATYSLWVTVKISRTATAGDFKGVLSIKVGKMRTTTPVTLRVWDFDLPEQPTLSSVNWLYTNQIAAHDGLRHLSEPWWAAMEEIARNMGEHHHDSVYTAALTPPNAPPAHEQAQLVRISHDADDRYRFDFRHLDRWVDLFRRHGVNKLHLSHLASPWGALQSNGVWIDGKYFPPEPIESSRFQDLLRFWLPSLQSWADNRKLTGRVYQYLSEEPTAHSYQDYAKLLEWMRTLAPRLIWTDTITEPGYAAMLDVPVPRIDILEAVRSKVSGPFWTYCADQPTGRYTNRFIDTPLSVLRLGYWQCFTQGATGILHGGYNCWHDPYSETRSDPFSQTHDGTSPAGDGFIVYPRMDGQFIADDPLLRDSVRHEMMRQGLQDHALFTLLAERAEESPDAQALLDRLHGEIAGSLKSEFRDGGQMEAFRREVGDLLSQKR